GETEQNDQCNLTFIFGQLPDHRIQPFGLRSWHPFNGIVRSGLSKSSWPMVQSNNESLADASVVVPPMSSRRDYPEAWIVVDLAQQSLTQIKMALAGSTSWNWCNRVVAPSH
ncbi:MAG: hypothetical protein WA732_03485, partial [Pseudolabrys sp.]